MILASKLAGSFFGRGLLVALASFVFPPGGLLQSDSPPSVGSQAAAAQEVSNAKCPVLPDEAVDPEIHVEYGERTVYLCCQKCVKMFQADPAAYAAKLGLPVGLGHEQDDSHAQGAEAHEHEQHSDTAAVSEEQGADEHDHSSHAAGASGAGKLLSWIGRFHPMVVHFPIALLLIAGLAELLALRTGAQHFAFAARFCLWAGALGALVAAPLGWANAPAVTESYAGFLARILFFHRWVGTATAVVSVLTLIACERSFRTDRNNWKTLYRAGLLSAVSMVAFTGHLGASLIYGWDYLAW